MFGEDLRDAVEVGGFVPGLGQAQPGGAFAEGLDRALGLRAGASSATVNVWGLRRGSQAMPPRVNVRSAPSHQKVTSPSRT